MVLWLLYFWISGIFFGCSLQRGYKLRRNWLKKVCIPLLNLKIESKGGQHKGSALYVCNHRSFIDPVVVCHFIDALVIAKAEVANYPIINKGAEATGVIWVKRDNQQSRNEVRDAIVEFISNGHNILVFPEGTVGTSKTTLPFKAGTFHEAAEHGFPVVPIALEFRDEKDFWHKGQNLVTVFFNQIASWCTEVKITIGEPIEGINGDQLKEQCQTWINDELNKMRLNWIRVNFQS
jgi:1-acyl-sn-glycerol-3-phosphate acyltransferase